MPGVRMIPTVRLTKAVYWFSVALAVLIVTCGCVASPAGAPSASPGVLASPVASPSPAAAASGANGAAATPALPPATVDVSPSQVQLGTVTLSMALEPARHMLAQAAALTSDLDPAHQTMAADQGPAAPTALACARMAARSSGVVPPVSTKTV